MRERVRAACSSRTAEEYRRVPLTGAMNPSYIALSHPTACRTNMLGSGTHGRTADHTTADGSHRADDRHRGCPRGADDPGHTTRAGPSPGTRGSGGDP